MADFFFSAPAGTHAHRKEDQMLKQLNPSELVISPFDILDKSWALLVAGVEHPNPMTVSWGGFGTLWNKPVVTLYVRPTRYTWQLDRKSVV